MSNSREAQNLNKPIIGDTQCSVIGHPCESVVRTKETGGIELKNGSFIPITPEGHCWTESHIINDLDWVVREHGRIITQELKIQGIDDCMPLVKPITQLTEEERGYPPNEVSIFKAPYYILY